MSGTVDPNNPVSEPVAAPTTPVVDPMNPVTDVGAAPAPAAPATPAPATPAPATPAPTTPVVDASEWIKTLPQDLQGNEKLSAISSVEDLARKFAEAPAAPTVPDADKYVLPEGAPAELGKLANSLGLSQEQFDGTMKLFNDTLATNTTREMQVLEDGAKAKLAEWGDKSPTYVQSAKSAVDYWDKQVPGLRQLLDQTGYGNHPLIMDYFRLQGDALKEGGFLPSNPNTPQGKKTTAQTLYPDQA